MGNPKNVWSSLYLWSGDQDQTQEQGSRHRSQITHWQQRETRRHSFQFGRLRNAEYFFCGKTQSNNQARIVLPAPSNRSPCSMATQIARASRTLAMSLQFHPSAHGSAVWNNPPDTCHAGRAYFKASYIQTDLHQQSSYCLCGLDSESVSLDSAREGSLE